MGGKERKDRVKKIWRPLDIFVVVLCLVGTAASLNLFRMDLFQTIGSQNAKPVGTVTIKYNTVQRRLADRVLWDRLNTESPVYSGDLIRVAELSEVVLHIDNKDINLNENTLIRIQIDKDVPHIELFLGDLSLNAGADGGNLRLTVSGNEMEVRPETVLNAASRQGNMTLQVNEGNVLISEGGLVREAAAGTLIALNADGTEETGPMAMVMSPNPNARYLKSGPEPLNVSFAWRKINMDSQEPLRLRISENRNFTRVTQEITAIDAAELAFDTGTWYWRLSHGDTVLSSGRVLVTDASGPALLSPGVDQVFRYQTRLPELAFRWAAVTDAAHYLLEVADRSDFVNPQIIREVRGTSLMSSELEPGTWFWRVKPVFPSGYEGSAGISPVASFRVERTNALEAPVLIAPASGSIIDTSVSNGTYHFSWAGNNEAVSYTVQIATNENLYDPVMSEVVQNNFYVYGNNERRLSPGQYFWGIHYTVESGNVSPLSQVQPFIVMEGRVIQRPLFPPDSHTIAAELLPDVQFAWTSNLPYESRFQISNRSDFSLIVIDEPVAGEFFDGCSLPPGNWFWRIYARDTNAGYLEFSTPPRRLNVTRTIAAPLMELPRSGSEVVANTGRSVEFRWQPVTGAEYYRFSLYANTNRDQPVYENSFVSDTAQQVSMDAYAEGLYYWTVQAVAPATPAAPAQNGPLSGEQFSMRRLRLVNLGAPASGESIQGLHALRQPTTFRWSSTESVGNSRFVISRNANPLQGQPEHVIVNPRQTFSLEPNTLAPGVWYWTIEAQTPEGHNISAAAPRQIQVLAVPLLPEAAGMQPFEGYLFGARELRANRNIVFSWQEVSGANAYIINLFQEIDSERRYIMQDSLIDNNSWTLNDLSVLDRGIFVWHIEAVYRNRNGVFEQRGQTGTNRFTVEFTLPGPVLVREAEIFYDE